MIHTSAVKAPELLDEKLCEIGGLEFGIRNRLTLNETSYPDAFTALKAYLENGKTRFFLYSEDDIYPYPDSKSTYSRDALYVSRIDIDVSYEEHASTADVSVRNADDRFAVVEATIFSFLPEMKHALTLNIGNYSQTLNGIKELIPTGFFVPYSNIPNAGSAVGTLTVDTYTGEPIDGSPMGGYIGRTQYEIFIAVPESIVPSISVTAAPVHMLEQMENWDAYVSG